LRKPAHTTHDYIWKTVAMPGFLCRIDSWHVSIHQPFSYSIKNIINFRAMLDPAAILIIYHW